MGNGMDLEEQYDKIYRYCYFKVHRRETAEDITQEAFLRLLESGTYRNEGRALSYLYTIARNLCIDEYRRGRNREYAVDDMDRAGTLSHIGEDTDESNGGIFVQNRKANVYEQDSLEERIVLSLALREGLEKLEEEERELVLLRYANEVPAAVIGRLLGISRFAVHRRIKGALKRLREKLGEEDFS